MSSSGIAWRTRLIVVLAALWGGACGGPSETDSSDSFDVVLDGAVQKGPFVLGSSITVSPLDVDFNPTGQTFLTQTANDKGEFTVSFAASGQVSIEGDGFYYNEVSGALSGAPLTLRALYVIESAGAQQAYINLVTHLTYLRVRKLVGDGTSFGDAVTQAEGELRTELALTLPSFDPGADGISMNILGGDSGANAYLLAVSAVIASAGGSDGGIQELSNLIGTDLEEDGVIGQTNSDKITAGLLALDVDGIAANLVARLDALGSSAVVPDMNAVVDQDRDGVVNANDNCVLVVNADQKDADLDGQGDLCDPCPAKKCADGESCDPTLIAGGGEGICVVACRDDREEGVTNCESPSQCVPTISKVKQQLCVDTCDPLSPSCASDYGCYYDFGNPVDYSCVPVLYRPLKTDGQECNGNVEHMCEPGLECVDYTGGCSEYCCRAFCDMNAGSPCGSGTCVRPDWFPDAPSDVGVCKPAT